MKKIDGYRKYSFFTDVRGIKNAIGEMHGWGYPKQPKLNANYKQSHGDPILNEDWFIKTIKEKIANHPGNTMEHPFHGEKIFAEPLIGFIRGADPIFQQYKSIIGPHHFSPEEIMKWQAENNSVPAPKVEDLSVVSFIMPMARITKDENATMKEWPSER